MSGRRKRCAAGSRCRNFETGPGRNGKRHRDGKRVQGAACEVTACGRVVCCEDCDVVHTEECEVRAANRCVTDEKAERVRADDGEGAPLSVRC